MRGHLEQRGNRSWRITAYVGRDTNGTKRYIRSTVTGTRRDAERELSRLLVEVDEGRHTASAPVTLDQLLDRWLKVKSRQVEASTMNSYEWIARTYIRPDLGDRRLASLKPFDLDDLYGALLDKGLSTRTVRICHTVLRQSLEQARKWGLIARSPAIDASPPAQRHKEIVPPTVADVQRLLEAAREEDPAFGTYLWVLAATGCRRGEGCALRWSDIDFDAAELMIRRSLCHVGKEVVEKETKTRVSRRIALDKWTIDELRRHRLRQRETALAIGSTIADDGFVFTDFRGPWRPDVCTNRFGKLRTQLDLDRVRLHDLRHFSVTALINARHPIPTVSTRVGHSQFSTTLNLYSHALPAADREAADYLGQLLKPIDPPSSGSTSLT